MKMKKRSMKTFLFYDYEHVEKHLEKMARKGWLLSNITKLYWEYRRIKPVELHFAVTYFPGASGLNPEPGEDQEEFWAYCEAAGWKLAAEWEQMQILYSAETEPVPLETDEEVRLNTIHRGMKKGYIPGSIVLLCLTVFQLLDRLPARIEWFYRDANPIFLVAMISFILYQTVMLSGYYLWYRRSVRSVESGGQCANVKMNRVLTGVLLTVTVITLAVSFVLMFSESLGIFLLVFGVMTILLIGMDRLTALFRYLGLSKTANLTLTSIIWVVVISVVMSGVTLWVSENREWIYPEEVKALPDDLLLVVEDVKEPDYGNTETVCELDQMQSMFINWTRGRQYATEPGDGFDKLEYQIYEVKTLWLYDHFLELITGEEALNDSDNWTDINDGRWEADGVYQYRFEAGAARLYEELYVVCQGNWIVRLGIDWASTEEELSTAFELLGIASEK